MTYPPPGGNPPPPGPMPPGGSPSPQMPPQPGGPYPGQPPMSGQPPPPPGQYPPPVGPGGPQGPYGFQPHPTPSNGGKIVGIIGGAVALILVVGLTWFVLSDDDSPSTASNGSSNSTADDNDDDPDTDGQTAGSGECLAENIEVEAEEDLSYIDCSDDEAFWEVTSTSEDISGSLPFTGEFYEYDQIDQACGGEFSQEPWNNWLLTYEDAISRDIDSIMCLTALPNEDSEGRIPKMPDEGECIVEADALWVTDCDGSLADWEVLDIVPTPENPEVPILMTEGDELSLIMEEACGPSGSTHYKPLELPDGMMSSVVTHVLCLDVA